MFILKRLNERGSGKSSRRAIEGMKLFPDIKNMKMHKKLLISYLIVVIIPIFIIGSFLIGNTKNIILDYINHINEITLKQMDTNISNEFRKYFKISDDILTESNLIDMLSRKYKSKSEYLSFYADDISKSTRRLQLRMPDSVNLSFFTTNNTIVEDRDMIFYVNESVAKQDWYEDAIAGKGKNVVSLPYFDDTGKWIFSISRMLYSTSSNKEDIVLRLDISLNEINDLMREEGKNKKVYLLDDRDRIFTLTTDNENEVCHIGDIFDIKCTKEQHSIAGDNVCLKLEEELQIKKSLAGWRLVLIVSPDVIMGDINRTVLHSIIICLIIMGIMVGFLFIFSYKLTGRLRMLTDSMNMVINEGDFEVDKFKPYDEDDEIGELSRSFKAMLERIDKLISEVYISELKLKDLELEKRKAEINALQSQINPHFLFNTMESISMNLLTKGDFETCEAVRSFANILRKSIEWDKDLYTLKNELDLVLDYLKVQKFRYKDKLQYEIYVEDIFYDVLIPKFTLQPIVENSIYHGLELKEGVGILKITTEVCGDVLKIVVEDNGLGIEKSKLELIKSSIKNAEDITINSSEHDSIGLSNINKRLVLYYGKQYGIEIDSLENIGTKVTIRLPIQMLKGEDGYV